ncbi:MAG TPA: hypothetical protein VNS49_01945 [Streptomyces sp.]|nr:hypothetical protein [Streptomyces sp.]
MPDSQNPRNAENAEQARPSEHAGRSAGVRDAGHVRAREISAARNTVKARGSAAAPRGRSTDGDKDAERLRRRARFLRERNEAKELRERVQPRRARSARLRQSMRMRTFRW